MIDLDGEACEDCYATDGLCAHTYWRATPPPWPRRLENRRKTLHAWARSRKDLPEWLREQVIAIYREVES